MGKATYRTEDLTVLEGLDGVRARPGMYIGSVDRAGAHHLVWEILGNAVDEALAGFASQVTVSVGPTGPVTVSDDGRGIPIEKDRASGLTGVEIVFSRLHAGAKFGGSVYHASGGLHGVGAAVVTALSSWVEVAVCRDGRQLHVRFENGQVVARYLRRAASGASGTTVSFLPDRDMFPEWDGTWDLEKIRQRLRELPVFIPSLTTVFKPAGGKPERFRPRPDGLGALLGDPSVVFQTAGSVQTQVLGLDAQGKPRRSPGSKPLELMVAFRFVDTGTPRVRSLVNTVPTAAGGVHLTGVERGVRDAVKTVLEEGLGPPGSRKLEIKTEDWRRSFETVVSLKMPDPTFSGQTKDALAGQELVAPIRTWAAAAAHQALVSLRPSVRERVLSPLVEVVRERLRLLERREEMRALRSVERLKFPPKLLECRSHDPARRELFICEGDSAMGTARLARDAETQALFPVRGKVLNVQRLTLSAALKNQEIQDLVSVIGAGAGAGFDVGRMRYRRVVLLADADVDGAHIRALLLVLFWTLMRQAVQDGRLWVAYPPLYRLATSTGVRYAYDDQERDRLVSSLKVTGISRFKGLGEMSPDQLRETAMDPSTRNVRQVRCTPDGRLETGTVEMFFGKDSSARRDWMFDQVLTSLEVDEA